MSVERCVKEEENTLCFYIANSKENLSRRVAASERVNTEDAVTSGKFKNRKHTNLNKTEMNRKCLDSSSGKCQRKLVGIKLGNGYSKVI